MVGPVQEMVLVHIAGNDTRHFRQCAAVAATKISQGPSVMGRPSPVRTRFEVCRTSETKNKLHIHFPVDPQMDTATANDEPVADHMDP